MIAVVAYFKLLSQHLSRGIHDRFVRADVVRAENRTEQYPNTKLSVNYLTATFDRLWRERISLLCNVLIYTPDAKSPLQCTQLC